MTRPCFVSLCLGLKVILFEAGILWDCFWSMGELHGLVESIRPGSEGKMADFLFFSLFSFLSSLTFFCTSLQITGSSWFCFTTLSKLTFKSRYTLFVTWNLIQERNILVYIFTFTQLFSVILHSCQYHCKLVHSHRTWLNRCNVFFLCCRWIIFANSALLTALTSFPLHSDKNPFCLWFSVVGQWKHSAIWKAE